MIVGNLIAKLTLDAKGFAAGVAKAARPLKTLNKQIAEGTTHLKDHYAALVLVGTGAVYATKKFADMAIEMQAINRRMDFVTGGGVKLARSWTFLRKTSKQLSISLEVLTSAYGNLAAATRSTGLATEQVESIFLGISQAASVFGLSAEKTRLAFMAVEQMASKGVISMEELRRQLGDQLPGALNTMSDALGVSTQQLNKLVSTGQLMSEDVLPLFALQLQRDMAEPVSKLGKGVRASMADFKTAWFDLKRVVTEVGGVGETVTKSAINIGTFFTKLTAGVLEGVGSLEQASVLLAASTGRAIQDLGELPGKVAEINQEVLDEQERLDKELTEGRKLFWANFGATTEEELKSWRELVVGQMSGVASEFTSLIVGMATGADVSFRKMLDNMAAKILEFTTHMLVVRPILEWFAAWLKGVTAPGGAGAQGIFGTLMSAFGAIVKKEAPTATANTAMAQGGMINEPVAGVGLKSGSSYLMGEAGPEAVIPADELGGGSTNVSVNIQAVDAKSVTDLMRQNPQAVIEPLVRAINGGDRGLNTSLKLAVS